jgi:predicted CxxxxCH...CXXCH cytochrome family protein
VPIACSTCHVVPSAITDPAHLGDPLTISFSGLAIARAAAPAWDGSRCSSVACHGAKLPDPPSTPAWNDTSGAQSKCGACHGIPPSQHTPSTECNRADCHGSEVSIDVAGAPSITAIGKSLHIDGIIESAR